MEWIVGRGQIKPVASSCGRVSVVRYRQKRKRTEGRCDLAARFSDRFFKRWALRRAGCPNADNCKFFRGGWTRT